MAKPSNPWRRLLDLVWQQPIWAIAFGLFFGTLFGANREAYLQAYKYAVVFSYAIGLGLWLTRHFVVPRLPVGPDGEPGGVAIGFAYVSISLVASYVAALVIHFTFGPQFLSRPESVLATGLYTLLFAALFSGIRYAMAYHQLALQRARAVEQARADLAQAELRALRAQINPHFLFNTLNAIASLIPTQPAAAEDMTTRLADLFRYALRASDREHAPLAEEMAFLRDYLAVERVRFGDRLRVEESVEPGLDAVPVPTLLLQPVVENAVRYAVAPRSEGGRIRVAVARRDGRLVLEVGDDGPGMDGAMEHSGSGFGLHAVRERLRAAGMADALTVESKPGQGVVVRITLPLETNRPSGQEES
jgi:sensor histidine kinase YesM